MPRCYKCTHEECHAELAALKICFAPKYCFTETRILEHQHGQLLVFKRGCEDPGSRAQLSTCQLFSASTSNLFPDLHISCCDSDNCNNATFQSLALDRPYSHMKALLTPSAFGITTSFLFIFILICVVFYHINKNRRLHKEKDYELGDVQHRLNSDDFDDDIDIEKNYKKKKKKKKKGKNNNEEEEEGSGEDDADLSSRGPDKKMSARTISKDIKLGALIGRGRYGVVHRATWKDTTVAVKSFMANEYASFDHEKRIYDSMKIFMSEYILNMIAAECAGFDSYTHHWIVTDYCSLGSLYDFLTVNMLTIDQAKRIVHSVLSGFHLLHKDMHFSNGKPQIAHRDIKSKNLLMSKPDRCVIADFGLAVSYHNGGSLNVPVNYKVGTKRYMAPEILNDTFNNRQFSSYLHADKYCIALVLWEIVNRIERSNMPPQPFTVAYEGMVPSDPTFEEMKYVVATRRPPIDSSLFKDQQLSVILKMIQESWSEKPTSRPTVLFLKQSIEKLDKTLAEH